MCVNSSPLPPSKSSLDVGEFARAVRAYCMKFSGSVTSWIRSAEHNHDVGGVPDSLHLLGLAVDVTYDGGRPGTEADAELASWGLVRIVEGDHDHIMVPRKGQG